MIIETFHLYEIRVMGAIDGKLKTFYNPFSCKIETFRLISANAVNLHQLRWYQLFIMRLLMKAYVYE
ncbi:hypothetical protein BBD42_07935 [Paenibacillus sp. BIHB 4019]|uniref:Uncharacterized protein n=1 Tax=Paenibacillus sp. BIHB 4019 TaxID=1870819 RepID=A0A1B2DF95_9BACL|nr:hypothetical protein [Paenibacillus sp. BIHB 4019]ANY66394.1 hypothetical protein BBD42_07935 [Paenibacillus sp. BIHB 4019]